MTEGMTESLRVLLIIPNRETAGGQAVQASRLLAGWAGDASVRLTPLEFDPPLPLGLKNVPVVRTLLYILIFWSRLLVAVPRHDVVHVFTAAYWGFLLWTTPAVLLGRLWRRPVVVNYRDGQCADHLRRWPGAVWTLRQAARVVTPSGFLQKVMGEFGLRACVISNVISLAGFRFRVREPLRPVFLSNRGLEPLYNVSCILRAFGQIQQAMPEARLIVAHDGPSRAALQAEAAGLGLRNVEWRGRVAAGQMAALYDECDVYLNTPTIDNMPGSLLESMASGLPIVSTDVGGIPFVVEHEQTALLVGNGDAAAVAREALRLWREPGLARRLAEQGYAGCRRYAPEAVLAEWGRLYREVAEPGSG